MAKVLDISSLASQGVEGASSESLFADNGLPAFNKNFDRKGIAEADRYLEGTFSADEITFLLSLEFEDTFNLAVIAEVLGLGGDADISAVLQETPRETFLLNYLRVALDGLADYKYRLEQREPPLDPDTFSFMYSTELSKVLSPIRGLQQFGGLLDRDLAEFIVSREDEIVRSRSQGEIVSDLVQVLCQEPAPVPPTVQPAS